VMSHRNRRAISPISEGGATENETKSKTNKARFELRFAAVSFQPDRTWHLSAALACQ